MGKDNEGKVCCICGGKIEGYGYNAYPIRSEGRCCRKCNMAVVIPERIRRFNEEKEIEE